MSSPPHAFLFVMKNRFVVMIQGMTVEGIFSFSKRSQEFEASHSQEGRFVSRAFMTPPFFYAGIFFCLLKNFGDRDSKLPPIFASIKLKNLEFRESSFTIQKKPTCADIFSDAGFVRMASQLRRKFKN